jgi:NitT/TauT family transport system ATP-binding protein
MSTPLISIRNVGKIFPRKEGSHRVHVLDNVNLTVNQGEFLVLLGPSGCGKSTLLRIISGLDKQTSGEVIYHQGFSFDKISFVFQDFGILPWLTVSQNIELNLHAKKLPPHQKEKDVTTIIEAFGLSSFKNNFPHELSGGMKQRVGLARAFVSKPDVIFLDEPFSELDFFTGESLRKILLNLWRELGTTVIMVSHYINEAVALADRIAVFSNRPSSIKTIILDTLPRPRNSRSQTFFTLEDEVLGHFEK